MIEIIGIVIDESVKPLDAIGVLRRFTTDSISSISERITAGDAVYTQEISNEEFYSGIRDFMLVVGALESAKIEYHLSRDGKIEERSYYESIITKLDNLTLEDFR